MRKLILIVTSFVYIFAFNTFSQIVFHQDIFNGGVTAGGFSTGKGSGTGIVELYVESGSTIRQAYLFAYSAGENYPKPVIINDKEYYFNNSTKVAKYNNINEYFNPIRIHAIDITKNLIDTPTDSFNVTLQSQPGMPNEAVCVPFIYIVYENLNLPKCVSTIILNSQDVIGFSSYDIEGLNPIHTSFPVGFSIFSDRAKKDISDKNIILLNNSEHYLGSIGGNDTVPPSPWGGPWEWSGVKGHFYYQNNTLYGLADDVANHTMSGTDGLADISPYLINNTTNLNFIIKHVNYPNYNHPASNSINLAYFFTYTSSCDTFPVSVLTDTTICIGESVELHAEGGQAYEWTAVSDTVNGLDYLSCTDCPNPVFTGTTNQVYTVRIWNTDSCSVIRPVRVNISIPEKAQISTSKSVCAINNGHIAVNGLSEKVTTLKAINSQGDTLSPNNSAIFTGLPPGDYTVYYYDDYGCGKDTVVTVLPVIQSIASFSANPTKGTPPIYISLSNESQGATDYAWFLNGEYQGSILDGFWADSTGVYDVELLAWVGDSACADTAQLTVLIYEDLIASLPNVFTPNNDGVNDFFNVKINLVVNYSLSILNRWGNVVYEKQGELTSGTHNLWDGKLKNGKLVNDGTYFYKIQFEIEGGCDIIDCKVEKNGTVQVFTR